MTLVDQRPTARDPRPWQFPAVERREVAGGRVLAAHLPGKPIVTAMLIVDAGAAAEPAGLEGVALLTARLLGEGTRDRDAYEFAVAAERLGASWDADVWWDSLRVGIDVPATELAAAVDLLAEAVRAPRLADADFQRLRSDRLDELRLQLGQPGPRAQAAFGRELWSADSRYAIRDVGDPETVAKVELGDVRAFHATRFAPGASTLVVAGDLSGVDLDAIAARLFDGWDVPAPEPARAVAAERDLGRRVLVVDRPGAVQSMLYVGHAAPPRTTPDYVPLTTAGVVLGGVFNSRLNHHLREVKGYTYGAFAGFDLRRDGGQFAARAAVQADSTVDAAVDTVTEIRRLIVDGVAEEELEGVRSFRAGVFPVAFSTPHAVAGAIGDLVVHDLPDDYFDRVRSELSTVPREAVEAAAAGHLHPDRLLTVIVGDSAAWGERLAEAGLGAVTVVTD